MEHPEPKRGRVAASGKAGPRKKRTTYTVAFRLDPYHVAALEKGAAAYGISLHAYARQRLVELLEAQGPVDVVEGLHQTQAAVGDLREDLARTLEVLLVNLARADARTIRSWIDGNLRRGEEE